MPPTDTPLPPRVRDRLHRHHDANIHDASGTAPRHAPQEALPKAAATRPGGTARFDRDDLVRAHVTGLPTLYPGDRIRVLRDDQGWWQGTVTATDDTRGKLQVRVECGTGLRHRPGTRLTTSRLIMAPVPVVYFTATIVTLDGSDTTAYGEACEPGRGYTEACGWWDPDRAYWRVREHRDHVTPDVFPDGERRSPARWLADRLTARLGDVESFDGGRTFYGAREAVAPGRLTGTRAQPPGAVIGAGSLLGDALAASRLRQAPAGLATLTAAAHAHGFTTAQLAQADVLTRRGGRDGHGPGQPAT
jgi:hypothetical protein